MIFVDTNYFLRFFLKDNLQQHLQAKQLFRQGAKGELELLTSSVVVFEVYWVFKSYYRKTRSEVIRILKKLLIMEFIQIDQRDLLEESLVLFSKTKLSLEDCYHLAFAKSKRLTSIKTFDAKLAKEFKKIAGKSLTS